MESPREENNRADLASLRNSRKRRLEDEPSGDAPEKGTGKEKATHLESDLVESEFEAGGSNAPNKERIQSENSGHSDAKSRSAPLSSMSETVESRAKRTDHDDGVQSDCPDTVLKDEDTSRPRKKGRMEIGDVQTESLIPKPSLVFRLPLELLAEILIITGSPQHVLAVARTCKSFCHTLLAEDAQFIWRAARRGSGCSFNPYVETIEQFLSFDSDYGLNGLSALTDPTQFISLPDPPTIFSEAAYAAFLYDSGPCENCGRETSVPYVSFALRFKVCNNPGCKRLPVDIKLLFPGHRPLKLILPTNECSDIFSALFDGSFWPDHENEFGRFNDGDKVIRLYKEMQDVKFKQKFGFLTECNNTWMQFCVELAKWMRAFNRQRRAVHGMNEYIAKKISGQLGWEYGNLKACTVFGSYIWQKTRLLETIKESDVLLMHDQIESQLLRSEEKKKRQKMEISFMKNRENVEEFYGHLRSKKSFKFLPSLPTFRQLPIIKLMQSGEDVGQHARGIRHTLQDDSVMRKLLDQEVTQWVEGAKQDLAVVLGFPRLWKTASSRLLHPVERLTARFLCTKCGHLEKKYEMDGCLDFAGACLHVCVGKKGKNDKSRKSKKAAWNPANFVKDEKAINVLKQVILAFGYQEEFDEFEWIQLGVATICNSCDPPMVVDSRSTIGHSHRHENMQVSLTDPHDKIASYLGEFPYEHGLVEKLLQRGGRSIQTEIDKKNFGCRHCLRLKQLATSMDIGSAPEEAPNPVIQDSQSNRGVKRFLSAMVSRVQVLLEGPREKPPPLFNFNGLRSHLKAKHGIQDIRDEDTLCYDEVTSVLLPSL